MTDMPETADAVEPSATAESSQQLEPASSGSAATGSPWLWLVAGLIAAAITSLVTEITLSREATVSEEYQTLSALEQHNDEQAAQMQEIETSMSRANERRLLIGCGAVVAICFGLFSGIIHRRFFMGVLGAIVGVGVAFGIAQVASQPILDLEKDAVFRGNDTSAILMHSAQWIAIGVSGAVAVALGSLRVWTGAKASAAMILAGILGGLLYVIFGTMLDPNNQIGRAAPNPGMARYLWASLPPLLAGLFLVRIEARFKNES